MNIQKNNQIQEIILITSLKHIINFHITLKKKKAILPLFLMIKEKITLFTPKSSRLLQIFMTTVINFPEIF